MSKKIITREKRGFWKKLLTRVTIEIMVFGTVFNTEARVTREVAEATIPYLLEAVGIPSTGVQATDNARRDAIVHMLYTDAGQREMVNWAVNDQAPVTLAAQFPWPNPSSNVIRNPNAQAQNQERVFRLLFPCGLGTFSSFAASNSRLGCHALNNAGANLVAICSATIGNHAAIIQGNANGVHQIINKFNNAAHAIIDNKLAKVLFVLDVCDTAIQIKNILSQAIAGDPAQRNNAINHAIANPQGGVSSEYDHRPISATSAAGQGDCVQTLYRHLINIAIQNDNANPRNFNVEHLPPQLHGYYTTRYGGIGHHVITIPATETEAGLTQLAYHQNWHSTLSATAPNITNGAIDDIVAVLTAVSNGIAAASALGFRAALPVHPAPLALTLITSTGAGGAGTDQQANANAIQVALNALDGRCVVGVNRFTVSVTDNPATVGGVNGRPQGTDLVIQILDQLWNRRITIGACIAGTAQAHAEIISID